MAKAAVWTMPIVMLDVHPQDANKLLAADDQQLVQALPAYCPDPAFGVGVGVGRPDRRADHLNAGGVPDIIDPGELAVPIAEQEPPCRRLLVEAGRQTAGLLGDQDAGQAGGPVDDRRPGFGPLSQPRGSVAQR
jgi:hypothetical protein